MKMIGVLMFCLMALAVTGCNETPPGVLKEPSEKKVKLGEIPDPRAEAIKSKIVDLSAVITNQEQTRSWVPLQINAKPSQQVKTIFTVLGYFERAHPDWEIKWWAVDKEQETHGTSDWVRGLWVEHKIKEKEVKK